MVILTSPCYLCGSKAVLDGLCFECFKKENPLVLVKSLIKLQICKSCGAVKVPGGWKKVRVLSELDEMTNQQLMVAVEHEVDRRRQDVEIKILQKNVLDRVHFIDVVAKGQSHESLPLHEETHPVEVRISYGTCDTCGLLSGGYHEAILQVRATDRSLTEAEVDEIINLVTQMTVAEYDKDTKAYVTDVTQNKYGLDFRIGSEHLCHRIAEELETQYLAEKKENYKLIGQDRGGKRKYRSTTLIRLPRFVTGDFVEIENKLCQILAISKNGISCFDLIERDNLQQVPRVQSGGP